jgi:GT2 family glycosyltransferase
VIILIPAYGAALKLQACLESLRLHAPADSVTYVLDDATPDESIRELVAAAALPRLHYARADANQGFVRTCNWGYAAFHKPGEDLLLLNSDTEVTAGALEEMQQVLHLHEKHGVVTPRSNNATIFSIPSDGPPLAAGESYDLWTSLRGILPRYSIMPTAVGFCMLIKAEMLRHFDLFDEIYSPGYNEENDFVCRINRYGYSAVAANWAYVFHYDSASFGHRRANLERLNRAILLKRYPEYERKVADYGRFQLDPVEHFARLYRPHKKRILYDLFHLPQEYNGTADFGLNLLRELRPLLEDEFELSVGLQPSERFFGHELAGYRIYEDQPAARQMFDLVFKPCQLLSWNDFQKMNCLAPKIAYVLQDIVLARCEYLSSSSLQNLFQRTAELADMVLTISASSKSDFEAYYGTATGMRVIHHATNLGRTLGEFRPGRHVLIMGNHYVHKAVADCVRHLEGDLPIRVLGTRPEAHCHPGVEWLASGQLSRREMHELLVNARVVVYPSHYEGFGLPVVDALALGKPVIALDNQLNRELESTLLDHNLHLIKSLHEVNAEVNRLFSEPPHPAPLSPRRWKAVADEYASAFRHLLSTDIDPVKLRYRWHFLRSLELARV